MFGRIIWGVVFIAGAIALIKYRRQVHDITGNIGMFDKYLGSTPDGFTVLGIIIMVLAITYMTGGLDLFLQGTLGRYFSGG